MSAEDEEPDGLIQVRDAPYLIVDLLLTLWKRPALLFMPLELID